MNKNCIVMSSGDLDYMSDDFLTECVEDVRPGLIFTQRAKREHEQYKTKKVTDKLNKLKNRPLSLVESESRETALDQPISSDNKGFALLQKLGFKPGSGLGKSGSGRKEPVPINLKKDRQGLGRAEALKEFTEVAAKVKKQHFNNLTNDYRLQLAEKESEKRTIKDLRKSQRICKRLDIDSNITEPYDWWYWPDDEDAPVNCDENEDETDSNLEVNHEEGEEHNEEDEVDNTNENDNHNEDDIEYTEKEKLEMLTDYLRKKHFYCIWCAVQYEDDGDLSHECPGPTYDDH